MKKLIRSTLIATCLCFSSSIHGDDDLQSYATTTDSLYRAGAGAHDGAFTAISASMIGWGIGLGLVIAIIAAVLHQSVPESGGGGGNVHCH
jgi:hypothetical protein